MGNDDLGRGMGPVLHWMHTGELILKKENFEHVMTAAVALKVTVLKRKLAEIAKDYEFHWVELPENAKEKERRAKREAARKAKADAKETEEKEAENEEEEAAADDDAEMEDHTEATEEETNEEEATEEAPVENAEAEVDPSFTKIGGKEMLDKIKELRRIRYFTELPEESLLYKTHIKRYTQQNRQSGNKPDNKRSNDDKNKTENNKRQRTNTGATPKKEWSSKSTHNGRQFKREAHSRGMFFKNSKQFGLNC